MIQFLCAYLCQHGLDGNVMKWLRKSLAVRWEWRGGSVTCCTGRVRLRSVCTVERRFSSGVQTGQTLLLKVGMTNSRRMFLFSVQTRNSLAITSCGYVPSHFIQPSSTSKPSLPPSSLSLFCANCSVAQQAADKEIITTTEHRKDGHRI